MKFLVIQTAFLGDVILTTPFLEALNKTYPEAEIHVVCTKIGAEILEGIPYLKTHVLEKKNRIKGMVAIRNKLKSFNFDAVFCIHRSLRSAWIGKNVKSKKYFSFYSWPAFLLGYKTVPYPKYSESIAYVDKPFELLKLFNSKIFKNSNVFLRRPNLKLNEKKWNLFTSEHLFFQENKKYIVISPFSVWGTKEWLPERFAEVGTSLVQDLKTAIVLIGSGSAQETSIAKKMELIMKKSDAKVLNLVSKTNLEELKGVISNASLLVGNDSAPIHIAAAFDVPTVAIFGPTVKKWGFFPLSSKSHVVESLEIKCRPCSLHGPKVCPKKHFNCMNSISAQSVIQACKSILEK